jgi:predicted RNase H-like nuclease (RuvC/YqgF family)
VNGFALFREWPPQAYGIWTLVFLAFFYAAREYRETRKLSAEDRQARREGFAAHVESLQTENRRLRTDLADLRREYDEYRRICQEENEQRIREGRVMENHIRGLERRLDAQAAALPRVIEAQIKSNGK